MLTVLRLKGDLLHDRSSTLALFTKPTQGFVKLLIFSVHLRLLFVCLRQLVNEPGFISLLALAYVEQQLDRVDLCLITDFDLFLLAEGLIVLPVSLLDEKQSLLVDVEGDLHL